MAVRGQDQAYVPPAVATPSTSPHNTFTSPTELAAISVTSRIPEFWTEMPRLWFAQFEAVMEPQKQGDASKFNLVVSKLTRDAIQQVSDIILSPPSEKRYSLLKERLLTAYEESEQRQFQKLVGEMELGDQKPSQLLRRMQELARNTRVPEQTLHNLWSARLPPAIRAVLTVSQDQKLENLAGIADKIMETTKVGDIAAVSTSTQFPMTELISQVHKLTLEVAALRGQVNQERNQPRGRPNDRYNHRSRSRSRPRTPRRTPNDPDWLCKYHLRYRHRAIHCEQPCTWKKPSEN